MIPYDDLVAALQAWRARQGLPVAAPAAGPGAGNGQARPGTPAPVAAAAPRTAPPAPPPRGPAAPAPLPDADHETLHEAEIDHEHEIEDGAMIEESHYENEGDDFAMSFAKDGHNGHVSGVDGPDGTETAVGHDPALDPERPSDLTDPGAAQRNGRDDW
ncbi:MAG TPA: hypothetical protein VGC41_21750 [Kofleriaceae bacterium]